MWEVVGGASAHLGLSAVVAFDVLPVVVDVVGLPFALAATRVRAAVGAAGRQARVRVGRVFQRSTSLAARATDPHS